MQGHKQYALRRLDGDKDAEDAKTTSRPSFVLVRRVHCAGLFSAAGKRILHIKAAKNDFSN